MSILALTSKKVYDLGFRVLSLGLEIKVNMEIEIHLEAMRRDINGGRGVVNPHTYIPISIYVPPYPHAYTPTPTYISTIIFISITLYLNIYL